MCSEKKKEANRRNARKSTGPRTDDGKARSRRNALKHGLTGVGTVLPADELELFQERLHGWTMEDRPDGEIESYLLSCAVLATVRVDRCAKLDLADVAERRKTTTRNWERHQRRRVRAAETLLDADPRRAVERLESFATGCNALIDDWAQLREALAAEEGWSHEHAARAIRLLGRSPQVADDPAVQKLRVNFLASQPEIDPDEVDAVCGFSTIHLKLEARLEAVEAVLPDPEAGRDAILALIAAEVARLEARRDELWRSQDGPELAAAIALETFDASADATLRRRYEMANALSMHRNLNQLARRRQEARRQSRVDEKTEQTPRWWDTSEQRPAWWKSSSEPPATWQVERPPTDRDAVPEPEPSASDAAFSAPEAPIPNEATESFQEIETAEPPQQAEAAAAPLRNEANETPSTADAPGTSNNPASVTKPPPGWLVAASLPAVGPWGTVAGRQGLVPPRPPGPPIVGFPFRPKPPPQ